MCSGGLSTWAGEASHLRHAFLGDWMAARSAAMPAGVSDSGGQTHIAGGVLPPGRLASGCGECAQAPAPTADRQMPNHVA